ncbi:ATP-dependent helicase HrpB [Aliiroseovarius crassostreae]|uniref:ATP-dependent helicase HrpB n=1 Tax=Aliiroseovarius crassostreae TaxID=154981 RepID=A0A9Q9LYS8_9RHOB|nr:ATP-dependent helicase HrpB [Aliiroseovarius crassostreae]UWP94773.1 ATP-dependent helicase HrpB [Aliiroseovarius crassostreae]
MTDQLPIHNALPALLTALHDTGRAVLMAPPGAGKTTVVPLKMLAAGAFEGRLIMLEPRRLAARTAAERMAQTLGEPVGQTVGYRIRGEVKTSKTTRIEVVTEGILTRMLQSDPSLEGVGAVIFDEFHERSLVADLGLALTWEAMGALRDDLKLVVMSATLDAEPVARLLEDAPIIRSHGRAFPVETRHLDRPLAKGARLPEATADLVLQALDETEGGVLVFLPGEGEIRRCEAALRGRLPQDCHLHTLFGAMEFSAQRAAIQPAGAGRKIVLATAIAETSLTIQDIRVVVDAGLARRARFDPGSGMSRLVTERVSKAEATQRQGRAGRVAEGVCYRLWTRGEEGGLPPFPPAEIETADLAPLALELAMWGAADGSGLAFLTPPNAGVLREAQQLLRDLGALDAGGRITDHGRQLARLPMHPRLGHMMVVAGASAAPLAALWGERDPLPRGADPDLALRLEATRDPNGFARRRGLQANRGAVERIRAEARRVARMVPEGPDLTEAQQTALAYPDRIGLRRPGDTPRFVLSGGKGCIMDPATPLANARLIVVTDTDGNPREAKIRQAIQISESELRELFADNIRWHDDCEWSRRDGRVVARRRERLGAVVLDDRIWKDAPNEEIARAMLDGVRDLGLRLSDAAKRFVARVELLRDEGEELPDMRESALMESLETWLLPHLSGVRTATDWKKFDALEALRARLDWPQMQMLDRLAPAHFETPLGRKVPIDYSGDHPEIQIRLQELFGVTRHPRVGRTPLRVTLLSPGHKPVQTTLDIPGFWASSYADVRKDMRGRYPKHPWPEDPTQADPTLRAKPRTK